MVCLVATAYSLVMDDVSAVESVGKFMQLTCWHPVGKGENRERIDKLGIKFNQT